MSAKRETSGLLLNLPLRYWQDFQDALSRAGNASIYLINAEGVPFSRLSQKTEPCIQVNQGETICNEKCLEFYSRVGTSLKSYQEVTCPFGVKAFAFPLFSSLQKIGTLFVAPLSSEILQNKEQKAAFFAKAKNFHQVTSEVIRAVIEKNLLGSQNLVLNSIYEISRLLTSVTALDEIFELIINSLIIIFNPEFVFLGLNEGDALKLVQAKGEGADQLKNKVLSANDPLIRKISLQTEAVDLSAEELKNLLSLKKLNLNPESRVRLYPLWGFLGMVGVLGIALPPQENENGTARIISIYANFVATALTNASLIRELELKSETDALTGLYSKEAILRVLDKEIERARRTDTPLSVIMMDLDNFKNYNDNFGHLAGDVVLKKTGEAIRSCLRKTDFAGRFGGDEFIVVLPATEGEKAMQVAERIRKSLASLSFPQRRVSSSFGVVSLKNADTAQALLARADEALYAAKKRGRGLISPEKGGNKE